SIQKDADSGKDFDILKSIQVRGIGLSGPCKTPDFVPASIYLRGQKSNQDVEMEDTTMADSLLEFSTAPVSAPSSPTRKANEGGHLVDVEVQLQRGRKGLGLRLVGGAEEGTQVRVGAITSGGPAELSGQIFPGDQLIAVNGVSVLGATHTDVVHLLNVASRSALGTFPPNTTITLSLRGYRSNLTSLGNDSSLEHFNSIYAYSPIRQYSFRRSCSEESSINSSAITPGGPAERSKQLRVGDKITEMNGYSLAMQSHADVVEQLCTKHHRLELTVERQQFGKVFQIPVLDATDKAVPVRRSGSRSGERRKQQQPCLLEPVPEALDSSWNSRSVGDEVLEINGTPAESLTYAQAVRVVKCGGDHLHLKLQRVNTRIYDLSL
ncbi:Membrane-associated guanylate kinase WW and PDZ domain-containing protein 2, partial [Taenia solium]